MKFKDAYRRANDSVHVRPELLEQMKYEQAKANLEAPKKRENHRAWWVAIPTAAAATALACVAVFVGMRMSRNAAPKTAEESHVIAADAEAPQFMDAAETVVTAEAGATLKNFASYEELAETMTQRTEINRYGGYKGATGSMIEAPTMPDSAEMPAVAANDVAEPVAVQAEESMPMPQPTDAARSETGTNVQVAGVDEADIVKTDGSFLYCLNREQGKLYIVSANGEQSAVTASATLPGGTDASFTEFNEMILANDKLYVIGTEYDWSKSDADNVNTLILVYAYGDRSSLKKIDTLKQQGSYRTARLIGDTLLTVSCEQLYVFRILDGEDAFKWCPSITNSDEKTLLPPDDIYLNETSKNTDYVLITTIDTQTGTQFDSYKAVIGGTDTVYCNETKLLIASREWIYEEGEEQTVADGKHFVKNTSHADTSLCLFDIDGGKIVPLATQRVEGTLLNQFSMDAYDDSFRLVVTRDTNETVIWTDGIDTYEYKNRRDCALYVLDKALEPIGVLSELAKDEMVQSVRFMGKTAYFVTFRQTDPLFAVDLSDPTNPVILSALKIPGFSAYLHPFGEGRLLGIGYSADEKTGVTDGVKLTLFDISDPSDVKVLETHKVNASYTTVQYNHKAVFVDVATGTVAFPADDRYFVLGVSDAGFTDRGAIDIGSMWWDGGARGIMLNNAFYVVTAEAVVVLSFDTMQKITEVRFQ